VVEAVAEQPAAVQSQVQTEVVQQTISTTAAVAPEQEQSPKPVSADQQPPVQAAVTSYQPQSSNVPAMVQNIETQMQYMQQFQTSPGSQQFQASPGSQQFQASPGSQQFQASPVPQQFQTPPPHQFQTPPPQQFQAPVSQQFQASPVPQQFQAPAPQQFQAQASVQTTAQQYQFQAPPALGQNIQSLPLQQTLTPTQQKLLEILLKEVRTREGVALAEITSLNERIEANARKQMYPLAADMMFNKDEHNDIREGSQPEVPNTSFFKRLDAATPDERRAFVARIMNDSQINHFIKLYELTNLVPDAVLPFNKENILEKASELLERMQWVGGGVYIDDTVWKADHGDLTKLHPSFCLTNTIDSIDFNNDFLDGYLDAICYCMERHFDNLDVRHISRTMEGTERRRLFLKFNQKDVMEERRRKKKNNEPCDTDSDIESEDDEDEEDFAIDEHLDRATGCNSDSSIDDRRA
jgi:hypothetical protein